MNVYNILISHAIEDCNIAKTICNILLKEGFDVFVSSENEKIKLGIEFLKQLEEILDKADILLVIITENFINSNIAQAEFGKLIFRSNKPLFTLEIGEIILPSYISVLPRYTYKLECFDKFNSNEFLKEFKTSLRTKNKEKTNFDNLGESIKSIRYALSNNRLTLVCGAGVSSSIGLPDWNTLLIRILNYTLDLKQKCMTKNDMKNLLSSSNLIVGKYLKILLRDEFDEVVSKCLYEDERVLGDNAYAESALLKNIIKLIRPKRNRGSVESVITFNFDSLLEKFLSRNSIKYKAIYDEGIQFNVDEVPIYHVHGYLPKDEKIEKHNLVFSEDGYHTQFIDPYSWSNLIQLYKYMNNSCIFIGISLTDPNIRRLLDISKRKNKSNSNKHFIIKKLPPKDSSTFDLQLMLEEQDSLMLGLNVIWVSDYDDYPKVLEKILE